MATPLRHLQRDYPAVQVGSYPDVSPVNNYLVRVALESKDVDLVEQVRMDRCHSRVMLSFAYTYLFLNSQAFAKLVLSLPVCKFITSPWKHWKHWSLWKHWHALIFAAVMMSSRSSYSHLNSTATERRYIANNTILQNKFFSILFVES